MAFYQSRKAHIGLWHLPLVKWDNKNDADSSCISQNSHKNVIEINI